MQQSNALRFSLRTLLIAVTFVAVGCTALLNANEWWSASLNTLCVLVFAVAILITVFRSGEARAICLGVLVWGVPFLVSISFSVFDDEFLFAHVNQWALAEIWPHGPPDPGDRYFSPVFHGVANSLWTILIAAIGGWVAWYLYRTAPKENAANEKPTTDER